MTQNFGAFVRPDFVLNPSYMTVVVVIVKPILGKLVLLFLLIKAVTII